MTKRIPIAISIIPILFFIGFLITLTNLTFISCANAENNLVNSKELEQTWLGVEVVTNDVGLIDRVRSIVGITKGEIIADSDPRLPESCDKVRLQFPGVSVNCRSIHMANATSLYVVELGYVESETIKSTSDCDANIQIETSMQTLQNEIVINSEQMLRSKNLYPRGEFVNSENYLDYYSPEQHKQTAMYNRRLKGEFHKLEALAKSCDPIIRATSIALMNFAGEPKQAVKIAIKHMNDENEGVRNNAMRLISTFGNFINNEDIAPISLYACENIERVNFLDRNKGLDIVWSLLNPHIIVLNELSTNCLSRIQQLAATSISGQIGSFARLILHIEEPYLNNNN